VLDRHEWPAALRAAREQLLGRGYGVIAVGIDRHRVGGVTRPGRGLVAFVARKRARPRRAIPALRVGRRLVHVDVVGVGDALRAATSADEVVFCGLHAGAAIVVESAPPEAGSLGCLLAIDDEPSHFVTAGHLFAEGSGDVEVSAARAGHTRRVIGRLERNLLDDPEGEPRDVALVRLDRRGRELARRSHGPALPTGLRSIAAGASVDAFLWSWRRGDFSGSFRCASAGRGGVVESDRRAPFVVADVLSSDRVVSAPGDSGTLVLSRDEPGRGLGLCIGQHGSETFFESLRHALEDFRARSGPINI
jgi:hypothetical protein